jgi:predicted MPP superfamily phosphohydrolase
MPWHISMLIRIVPFLAVPYLYVGWRISTVITTLFPAPVWRVRLAVLLVILLLNLLPIVILYLYQTGNGSDLFLLKTTVRKPDYLFTYPFWFGLILVVEILPYFLSLEILNGIFRFIPGIQWGKWIHWRALLYLIVSGFFAIYVGIRMYVDTTRVRLNEVEINVENLPPALENLDVTFVSDIQVDRYTQDGKLNRFKNQLKEADSDMLLFAGDLVTSGEYFITRANELLCEANAPLGRFACMGDHDFWANPVRIASGLSSCGWTFLQNQHRVLEHNGSKILITGITYIYSRRISPAGLRELLGGAPDADLKICLVHQPSNMVIRAAKEYGYHLVLAGHTHGGQVVFRPFGIPLTPSRFESTYFSGYGEYEGMPVFVTNGVGLTLAPVRYQAPAEVVKFKFVKK